MKATRFHAGAGLHRHAGHQSVPDRVPLQRVYVAQATAPTHTDTACTHIGLLVAWVLLMMPLDAWCMCGVMIVLTFVVESIGVRHYGLATVFITPLTILLAEAATLGHGSVASLMQAHTRSACAMTCHKNRQTGGKPESPPLI